MKIRRKYILRELLLRAASLMVGLGQHLLSFLTLFRSGDESITIYVIPSPKRGEFKAPISGGIINIAHLVQKEKALGRIVFAVSSERCRIPFGIKGLPNALEPTTISKASVQILNRIFSKNWVIHVPEYLVDDYWITLTEENDNIVLNVLNQNKVVFDEHLNVNKEIQSRLQKHKRLSITCAHESYVQWTQKTFPNAHCYLLGVWVHHSSYEKVAWPNKQDLILLSPDDMQWNRCFIDELAMEDKRFAVQVVQNVSYSKYLKLLGEAKYVITSGEGMDGYFVESFFSGAVGIAKWNEDFFPPQYPDGLENVRADFSTLAVLDLVTRLDNNANYRKNICDTNLQVLNVLYGKDLLKSLEHFYVSLKSWLQN